MWELTKRISLRTSSVFSKVEPEPDLHTGFDQKVPALQDCNTVKITGNSFLNWVRDGASSRALKGK